MSLMIMDMMLFYIPVAMAFITIAIQKMVSPRLRMMSTTSMKVLAVMAERCQLLMRMVKPYI